MLPRSRVRRRLVATLAVLAALVVPAVVGYEVGSGGDGRPVSDAASAVLPQDRLQVPTPDANASESRDADADLSDVADQVDDVVVNVYTEVEGGGQGAGSGIVLSDGGLILTNNHVIAGSTGLTVEFGETGVTRSAKVLGYSIVDDVALIQVQNVGNRLTAAKIGVSTSLEIGETILALGNAGGRGGSPNVVTGAVTALDQEITASDTDGTNAQTLDGLIEHAAAIRSGDSGGPVVDTSGTVVGMTVAASSRNGSGFPGRSGAEGYAIPIEDAVAIARRIVAGDGGSDIRVGATRAVVGVQIQPELASTRAFPGRGSNGATSGGAVVVGVEEGSGADKAGIEVGDVIVGVGGRTLATSGDLIRALVAYDPGDSVTLTWRDADGATQRGNVKLGEGAPA